VPQASQLSPELAEGLLLLAREHAGERAAAGRDDLWRSIVLSITAGQTAFGELSQRRLLDIAASAVEIGELASAVMAPKCAADGSPMITSQAATVLAAFRHLKGIVSVLAPDRLSDVMSNIATAAVNLNPQVVMQVMQTQEDPVDEVAVVKGMTAAFDDVRVAQLLSTVLALEGGLGPAGHHLQHHCAGCRSQAPRADHDAQHVERDRLRPIRTIPSALDIDGGAARLVQRETVRVRVISRRPRRRTRTSRTDGGS
jgi:hypothetical protein